MACTFVLIHGAGDVGWYWHLVDAELRARGHAVLAPDLPCEDDEAGIAEYADVVVEAIEASAAAGDPRHLIVVGQSLGAFTAVVVAGRVAAELLVLVAPMIPAPGEAPADHWANTRYGDEPRARYDDDVALFYEDVPAALAAEALRHGRAQSEARLSEPAPFDVWPDVPTKVVLGRDDRLLPPSFVRRVARDRLGVTPDEIDGGHTLALSRPTEVAAQLLAYAAELGLG